MWKLRTFAPQLKATDSSDHIKFKQVAHVYEMVELYIAFSSCSSLHRGQQILKGYLDDLLASGMTSASEIILTGCSGE